MVIPSYNQRERATRSANEAHAYLRAHVDPVAEIVVVDDGSAPGQVPVAAELPADAVLLRNPQNLGKGGAVRAGMLAATGRFVVFTDSDLPFTLEPIADTVAMLEGGADVVIGDRLLEESEAEADVTLLRRLSSAVFTFMVRQCVGIDFRDTQCGYKGYRAAVVRPLFEPLEVTSFAFDVEVLVRAIRSGYTVRRQPIRLVNNEDTSVRLSRHAPQMVADMLRIAWRARRGHYG